MTKYYILTKGPKICRCIICVALNFYLFAMLTIMPSCKKFITVDPPKTQLSSELVFTDDVSATAAMVGIYSTLMGSSSSFVNSQLSYAAGLSADELVTYSASINEQDFYTNSLSTDNAIVASLWRDSYNYIYQANAIIEAVSKSSSLSVAVHDQILGEAKFIRSFVHFYLVNLFGDVPYITTTDYRINNKVLRMPANEVYRLLVEDLIDSRNLLKEDYVSNERTRPNRSTASAMLARVYLYQGEWEKAEIESSIILSNTAEFNLNIELNDVFTKNSKETIWQLAPVIPGINTNEAQQFILTDVPTSVALSDNLMQAFDDLDLRRTKWINSIVIEGNTYLFPYKYKIRSGNDVSEFLVLFRLAEQYLIRAESRAQLNKLEGARSDLNIIRNRAGLSDTSALLKEDLLRAIEWERRLELFSEQGHRWLDLKRTNRANEVLGELKPETWASRALLYPIPLAQILSDPQFSQNPGY
jgi:hypothetical protein